MYARWAVDAAFNLHNRRLGKSVSGGGGVLSLMPDKESSHMKSSAQLLSIRT